LSCEALTSNISAFNTGEYSVCTDANDHVTLCKAAKHAKQRRGVDGRPDALLAHVCSSGLALDDAVRSAAAVRINERIV